MRRLGVGEPLYQGSMAKWSLLMYYILFSINNCYINRERVGLILADFTRYLFHSRRSKRAVFTSAELTTLENNFLAHAKSEILLLIIAL